MSVTNALSSSVPIVGGESMSSTESNAADDARRQIEAGWVLRSGGMDLTGLRGRRPVPLSRESQQELRLRALKAKARARRDEDEQTAAHC